MDEHRSDPPPPPELIPALRPADDVATPSEAGDVPVLQPVDGPPDYPPVMGLEPATARRHAVFWLAVLVFGIVYVGMLFVGGKTQRIAFAGLESLPFLGLALLAYAGEEREEVRFVALVYWLLLVGVTALVALLLTIGCVFDPAVLKKPEGNAGPPVELFLPGGQARFGWAFLATAFGLGLGVIAFLPPVRRAFARRVPLDPESFVHAVALATVLTMTVVLVAPLLGLGEPPLLLLLQRFADHEALKELSNPDMLYDQLYALAWLVPAGIIAVGYPLHRTLPEALRRVGLVMPSSGQVAFALVFAGVLAVVMTGFDLAIGWLWKRLGWPTTDAKQFEELMKFAINPLGAVVIGVSAGLGEELFARGVLQPRLGIILSNLFFTALHGLQYNWDGLVSVFVIGLILGVIRKRTNTSTSAIVHGTYDFVLIMMAAYHIDPTTWFQ
jgi:membrane protease YdiL (CAAX protease family)